MKSIVRDPRWSVAAGGLLVVTAMVVGAVLATRSGTTAGMRTVIFVGMLIVMCVGGVLMLRDWSRPRRRR